MAREATPEEIIALLTKRMEQASPEHVLTVLSQAHSIEEIEAKVAPVFDRLPRDAQAKAIDAYRRIADEQLVRSFKLGKEARLRDLKAIRELNEPQLKALTIAAAYYIRAEQQERLTLTDPNRFVDVTQYPQGANVNRTAVRLLIAHYLGYEMPRSADGLALFDRQGVRETVQTYLTQGNFGALRDTIVLMQYTPQDVKRICKALYERIADSIEETYKELGKELSVRKEVTRAWTRLSLRGAGWVLLAVMLSDFHFPTFSSWFRKTSKEYEKVAIEQVYTRHEAEIRNLARQQFGNIPQPVFDEEKVKLQKAIEEQYQAHDAVVNDFKGVIVGPNENVNEEIKKVLRNEKLLDGIKGIVARYVSPLGGLFDDTYQWKKYAAQEQQNFEKDIWQAIDDLFKSKEFLTALEKDKQSGIVEVRVSSSFAMKYVDRGLYWTTTQAKNALKWTGEKSLATLTTAVRDLFVETFNYIWGTLTSNEQRTDEAKNYFTALAALIGGMGAVVALLFILVGPWALEIMRLLKGAIKWSIKGGVLFYKVMITGAVRDVLIITGRARIESMATQRIEAQASIGHKSFVDRILRR